MTAVILTLSRILLLAFSFAASALAQLPPVDRVSFAPSTGATLPLNAHFVDEHGRAIRLGDYFGRRPVILALGYYGCSNLCSVLLHGLMSSLAATGLRAG